LKGDISVACTVAELVKRGIAVSLPTTDNKRYDLIMDYQDNLYRMQVKTANYNEEKGILTFKNRSINSKVCRTYTSDEIEGYLVFSLDFNKVYLVWIHEAPTTQTQLRTRPTLSNQQKLIRYATEYELDVRLNEIERDDILIEDVQ